MGKILEPYVRDGGIVKADEFRQMIFLAGTPEELRNYLKTVEIFDVDWLEGMSVGIFPLQTVDVESIIVELETIFGSNAESPLAGMFRFIPLERLASVMVITFEESYRGRQPVVCLPRKESRGPDTGRIPDPVVWR
jgi:general secretion pathway protein D